MARTRKRSGPDPVYVLNGPNLNLLGSREPEIYGRLTLAEIEQLLRQKALSYELAIDFRQSNSEGTLIDWLQEARQSASAVIFNAGGYSHTSIALLDACRALGRPLVEVHLSNPYAREAFRHRSYIGETADGVICGFGAAGYCLALEAVVDLLKARRS